MRGVGGGDVATMWKSFFASLIFAKIDITHRSF
jgi:hypothetical protein